MMRKPSPRAIPWGFLGMAVIVTTVELLLVRGHPEYTGIVAVSWSHKSRYVKPAAMNRQVLCFGDSYVNFGVVPQLIESRTGLSGYNLAVYNGAPVSYFLFRRVLESGAAAGSDRRLRADDSRGRPVVGHQAVPLGQPAHRPRGGRTEHDGP